MGGQGPISEEEEGVGLGKGGGRLLKREEMGGRVLGCGGREGWG